LRLQLNKDARNPLLPATLKYPQLQVAILIGEADRAALGQKICLYQPQIFRILKTIELIGFFNEFKDGVLRDFFKNLTSSEKNKYLNDYISLKQLQKLGKKLDKVG